MLVKKLSIYRFLAGVKLFLLAPLTSWKLPALFLIVTVLILYLVFVFVPRHGNLFDEVFHREVEGEHESGLSAQDVY